MDEHRHSPETGIQVIPYQYLSFQHGMKQNQDTVGSCGGFLFCQSLQIYFLTGVANNECYRLTSALTQRTQSAASVIRYHT